jgi:hypothetical protein
MIRVSGIGVARPIQIPVCAIEMRDRARIREPSVNRLLPFEPQSHALIQIVIPSNPRAKSVFDARLFRGGYSVGLA